MFREHWTISRGKGKTVLEHGQELAVDVLKQIWMELEKEMEMK